MNEIFEAGVQYDDFKGSVAADASDNVSLLQFLRQHALAGSRDLLAGVRIASGENDGSDVTEVSLVAYLYEADEFGPKPAKVRAVECIVPVAKLFAFFKRFDLVMTRRGSYLGDSQVDGPHH